MSELKSATRPLLLLITLALGMLHEFYDTDIVWGYLFSDSTHNAEAWIYFLCEHLIVIALAYDYWQVEPEFRKCATAFLWLSVVDLVDYILTCNDPWFSFLPEWATVNVFKFPIFGFVIVRELIKNLKR